MIGRPRYGIPLGFSAYAVPLETPPANPAEPPNTIHVTVPPSAPAESDLSLEEVIETLNDSCISDSSFRSVVMRSVKRRLGR